MIIPIYARTGGLFLSSLEGVIIPKIVPAQSDKPKYLVGCVILATGIRPLRLRTAEPGELLLTAGKAAWLLPRRLPWKTSVCAQTVSATGAKTT